MNFQIFGTKNPKENILAAIGHDINENLVLNQLINQSINF